MSLSPPTRRRRMPDPRDQAIAEHKAWLAYLQPIGVVVEPVALVDAQVQLETDNYPAVQQAFRDALAEPTTPEDPPRVGHFPDFARRFLGWEHELLDIYAVSHEVPALLQVATGEGDTLLTPTAAYRHLNPPDDAPPWILLVKELEPGTPLDDLPSEQKRGWVASPISSSNASSAKPRSASACFPTATHSASSMRPPAKTPATSPSPSTS